MTIPRDVRLMDIALLPGHRGTGIVAWIVGNLLEEGARLQTPVTLHVEPYNRALRLYERLGFRTVEQRDMNLFMEWRPASMESPRPARLKGSRSNQVRFGRLGPLA